MTTSLVEPGSAGKYRFIRQQDTEKRPYTNCRVVAFMMQLLYAGIEFPDDDAFCARFRKITGVPEVSSSGKTQGTSAANILYASSVLLPWIPVAFGPWTDQDLLDWLAAGKGTASIVGKYNALPDRLRIYSPSFTGTHEFLLRRARVRGKTWEVLFVDCLGPKGHYGEWVKWSTVRAAFKAGGAISKVTNRVFATTVEKGAGLSTFARPSTVYPVPAAIKAPKGVDTFVMDNVKGTLARSKKTTSVINSTTSHKLHVSQYPDAPPSGDFIPVLDGTYRGLYIRASDATITPPAVPGDCQAAVDAATQPLEAEIAAQESAIAAAMAALKAVA